MFKTILPFCFVSLALFGTAQGTQLDDYVWKFDSHYHWVDMGATLELKGKSLTGEKSWVAYAINMTSQKWLTDADFANTSDTKSIW